ncbi:MAG: hypothetical protein QM831_07525 [Kofleriaceae bacterium]
MLGGIEYQIWLDGDPVTDELYTRILTVTVEQGIDLATEARIELMMFADDQGEWNGISDATATTFKRLRLEARNQTSEWIPLIDGPIISWQPEFSGEPGQSVMAIVAQDDTVLLNREAKHEVFEGDTDTDVIMKMFDQVDSIGMVIVDTIPPPPNDRPLKHMKRGTPMDMLIAIAEPWDLHVYVQPDDQIGKSVGYVKRLSTSKQSTLPPFILTGSDRNVETFSATNDVKKATRYRGQQTGVGVPDTSQAPIYVTRYSKDDPGPDDSNAKKDPSVKPPPKKVTLLDSFVAFSADNPSITDYKHLGTELLSPFISASRDVVELLPRWQQRSSYTITASGSVRYGCYDGVLRAYDTVGVSGVNAMLCTNFIVKEVTHTFSRSEYRQDFTLITNSTREPSNGAGPVPPNVM